LQTIETLRQIHPMAWLAELLIQGLWEGIVEGAYRKWGLMGGAVALLGPFVVFGLLIWWVAG
jgi:hypothetical protein